MSAFIVVILVVGLSCAGIAALRSMKETDAPGFSSGSSAGPKPIMVRRYPGTLQKATEIFQKDTALMAERGYFPKSETYVPGTYGAGEFVAAVLLCFLIIGFLVFLYMLFVKPDGVLAVTYEYRGTAASRAMDEKTCPKCAEQVKAAAKVCRFCGHEFPVVAPAKSAAVETPTQAEEALTHDELMSKYGISHDGNKYQFQQYRYDRLEDAVAYARRQKQ